MAQALFTGYGERLIAAATKVTNSTKDSVTNVKNETESIKDACIRYFGALWYVDHGSCVRKESLWGGSWFQLCHPVLHVVVFF